MVNGQPGGGNAGGISRWQVTPEKIPDQNSDAEATGYAVATSTSSVRNPSLKPTLEGPVGSMPEWVGTLGGLGGCVHQAENPVPRREVVCGRAYPGAVRQGRLSPGKPVGVYAGTSRGRGLYVRGVWWVAVCSHQVAQT